MELEALFFCDRVDLDLQFVELRFDQIGRPHCDRFVAVEHARLQLFVDGDRRFAVFAAKNCLCLLGDVFVALAEQDVQHGLCSDNLRRRRDERDIAQVLAHAWYFFQHVVEGIGRALVAQLLLHIGQHAARHLRDQNASIHALEAAFELGVLLADVAKVIGDLIEQTQIEARVAFASLQDGDDRFGGRVPVGHAHRRDRRVEHVDAGFGRFDVSDRAHAGRCVRLHRDRYAARFLQARHELERDIGL